MLVLWRSFSYTPRAGFRKEFSYTLRASFSEKSLTLIMVVPVRCFSYTSHADHGEEFLIPSLRLLGRRKLSVSHRPGLRQDTRFSYAVVVTTTQKQSQMLRLVQTKMQEQGLTGYSSVRLTSRASHKLGKCRLSWV